jgi:tripartite-type tricarboxylate transporter receptor subunit TctC
MDITRICISQTDGAEERHAGIRHATALRRRSFITAAASLAAPAFAQAWPGKTIRMIVPYSAGGGADTVGRIVAQHMSQTLGQSVVVENRTGAAGMIAAEHVVKSPADGYTVLFDGSPIAVNPFLYAKVPFDLMRDLTPVSLAVINPNLLLVTPALPVNSVQELIALARLKPGMLTYGGVNGSGQHMAGALFRAMSKTDLLYVPYKGGALALNDLMGGHLNIYFSNIASGMPLIKSGHVKALAVTSAKRSASAPNLSTVAESGLPGYEVLEWNGLFVPSATPKAVVTRLHEAMREAMASAEVKARLFSIGAEGAVSSPAEFSAFLRNEMAKWSGVIKAEGIRIE